MIEVGTVCTGIGSPEQALRELGIPHKIKFACEKDKYARKSYLENFNPELMLEDMTKESWIGNQFKSDLYVGGIPCQSFSLAGKRLGELDPRGLLFYDFYRYVKQQQPKYFIIENVKGLISDNKGKTFRNWKDLLGCSENGTPYFFPHEDSLMYNLHWSVLNTKDYELPQHRERVFLIGIRNDLPNDFNFPAKFKLYKRIKHIMQDNVPSKYYLSKRMIEGFIKHAERHAEKGNGFKFETIDIDIDIANTITTTEGSRGYNNFIKEGFINQDTQASQVFNVDGIFPTLSAGTHGYANGYIIGYTRDKKRTVTERHLKDISGTLDTSSGSGGNTDQFILENERIRRLTPLECFRLQGYPDSFFDNCQKVNSDTQLYKQAGNTISVTVIKAILKNLLKYEKDLLQM